MGGGGRKVEGLRGREAEGMDGEMGGWGCWDLVMVNLQGVSGLGMAIFECSGYDISSRFVLKISIWTRWLC